MAHIHAVKYTNKIYITIQTDVKPGIIKMPKILTRVLHLPTKEDLKFVEMTKVATRL
jgi:hypothetical protein